MKNEVGKRKKRRKKFTLKKIKRIVRESLKGLKGYVHKIPSKVRIVIIIWVVILLLIVAMVLAGNANKKFLDGYADIESKMNEATLQYVSEKEIYPTNYKPLNISLDTLVDFKYFDEKILDDKICKGYSSIYYDDMDEEYVVNSYLNCSNYTSKGYEESE